ncbi:MAG: helix-turn-helix domain-containing protein [Lachnospiraceae bacterium]
MTIIGRKIKERREALGLTQDELAKMMGYRSRSSINKIEIGKTDINQTKISQFAEKLGTTEAYLMGWDQKEEYNMGKQNAQLSKKFDRLTAANKQAVLNIIDNLLETQSDS